MNHHNVNTSHGGPPVHGSGSRGGGGRTQKFGGSKSDVVKVTPPPARFLLHFCSRRGQANSGDDVPSTPGADGADGESSEPQTPKVMHAWLLCVLLQWRCSSRCRVPCASVWFASVSHFVCFLLFLWNSCLNATRHCRTVV